MSGSHIQSIGIDAHSAITADHNSDDRLTKHFILFEYLEQPMWSAPGSQVVRAVLLIVASDRAMNW